MFVTFFLSVLQVEFKCLSLRADAVREHFAAIAHYTTQFRVQGEDVLVFFLLPLPSSLSQLLPSAVLERDLRPGAVTPGQTFPGEGSPFRGRVLRALQQI